MKNQRLMLERKALRFIVSLALAVVLAAVRLVNEGMGVRLAHAQAPPKADATNPVPPAQSAEEKAIRAVDDEFIRSYNKGHTKALTALFTEDAEVLEANGDRYRGHGPIEQSFAETFAVNKGAKIELDIEAIRLLSPDVAKEEGRVRIIPTQGAPVSRLYTVLFARQRGRWLISSVREDSDPYVRPHDRLKDLEWMVGDWIDEGADSVVRLQCRWSEDENFLFRTFTVKRQGKSMMSVNQRIGWDPIARQIRSWEFDSEGGFGEGKWSRDGERWIIKSTGVRPEGATASATNVMARLRPDLVKWVSTDRVIGDQSVPDEVVYVMVRVPSPPKAEATSTTSPKK